MKFRRPWLKLTLVWPLWVALLCCLFATSASQATFPGKRTQVKVALIDFNPELRDVNANIVNLTKEIGEAFANGANIIVTPELATTGYSITAEQVTKRLGIKSPFKETRSDSAVGSKLSRLRLCRDRRGRCKWRAV